MMLMSEDDWVFLNGTVYFRSSTCRSGYEPIIASYDTDKDIMREISLPETQYRCFFLRSIGVLHDSLVFFTRKPDDSGLNMWVLKGGTNEYYWEKFSVNLDGINCNWTSNGGALLSKLSGNKLVSYNVEKDERKDFADSWDGWFEPGKPGRWLSLRVDSFSESPVLINS